MKTQLYAGFAILAAIGVVAALVVSRSGAKVGHSEKDWSELNAKVQRLELKTAELQKELDETRISLSAGVIQPPGILKLPGTSTLAVPGVQPPRGSTPFVFNGTTYYFTPLAQAR